MLTEEQKTKLRDEAGRRGVDPDELISEAEKIRSAAAGSSSPSGKPGTPPGDPPKLFQYHLPFVTVREVRQVWLGLTDSFPGDSSIASEWAAKHGGDGAPQQDAAAPIVE